MTMEAKDVLDIFTVLNEAGVSPTLEGGWGVEALLGEQNRDHVDLDLVLEERQVAAAIDALAAMGFQAVEAPRPESMRLADDDDRVIDLRAVATDAVGNGWVGSRTVESGDPDFPAESFTYGWVAGKRMPCISPDLQAAHIRSHLGITPDTLADAQRLGHRFSVTVPRPSDTIDLR